MRYFEEISCDLLVIGGGAAGCMAAIAAKEEGEQLKVILVDKGYVSRSGQSPFAAGVYTFFQPEEDNLDEWMHEIVESGEYLNDQLWCRQLFEKSAQVAYQIESWAKDYGKAVFIKNDDGTFVRRRSRGHIHTRHMLMESFPMMDVLRKRMEHIGVKIVDRVMVTDLLSDDEGVRGALGLSYLDNRIIVFKARRVIVSASGSGFKSVYLGHRNLTGDLQAAAFKAGASFTNMEQCYSNTTARDFDIHGMNLYVSIGGKFVNKNGEEFMPYYNPELGNRARLQDLNLAFAREVKEGRGPIFLDLTGATKEDEKLCRRILPGTAKLWDRAGMSPFRQKVEWMPAFRGTCAAGGGIKIDLNCFTGVEGLFAAGDITRIGPHGVYSFGGINISYCAVSGDVAGRQAVKFLDKDGTEKPLSENYIKQVQKSTLEPLTIKKGITPEEATLKLQEAIISVDVTYLKSKRTLTEALDTVYRIKSDTLSQVKAVNAHDLAKAIEFRSMALVAEMILLASLTREESRGFHFREEFPYSDNKNWLKLVVIKKDEKGGFQVTTEPVDTPYIKPVHERMTPPGIRRPGNQ